MPYKPVKIEQNQTPSDNGKEGKTTKDKPKVNKRLLVEEALGYYYEFRRNMLTKIPEYRLKEQRENPWRRMTDDDLYSIERRLQLEGYAASENLINKIIKSDYAPAFHPIKDYFGKLPKWDGHDHIRDLCATVKTSIKPALWEKYFKKWLVGVVANALIDKFCANHLCPILAGGQGQSKSKWINTLYPPVLYDYCKDGGIDPDNKDSLIQAAENLIINMDDYFADISAKKVNSFKGFITLDKIKIRRPYGRFEEVMPKICSFIGSTNEAQFLYDDTGDRRFLCFEIREIDLPKAKQIDINKVYSQAQHLFRNDYVYWVTKEEQQAEQHDLNAPFRVQSYEYEMVYRFFTQPANEEGGEFLTTTQIGNYLGAYTKAHLSLKRLGQALKLQGYRRKSNRVDGISTYGYYIEKTPTEEEHKIALDRKAEKRK